MNASDNSGGLPMFGGGPGNVPPSSAPLPPSQRQQATLDDLAEIEQLHGLTVGQYADAAKAELDGIAADFRRVSLEVEGELENDIRTMANTMDRAANHVDRGVSQHIQASYNLIRDLGGVPPVDIMDVLNHLQEPFPHVGSVARLIPQAFGMAGGGTAPDPPGGPVTTAGVDTFGQLPPTPPPPPIVPPPVSPPPPPCPFGYQFNPLTGMCDWVGDAQPGVPPIVPPPTVPPVPPIGPPPPPPITPPKPVPSVPDCPPGFAWNAVTQTCEPIFGGTVPPCPPGTNWNPTTQQCEGDAQPGGPPIGPPPPIKPPRPPVPPVPPIPPPPQSGCPQPAEQKQCSVIPVTPLIPVKCWIEWKCNPDDCTVEVCTYTGQITPTARPGYNLAGPFDSCPDIGTWVRQNAATIGCAVVKGPPAPPVPPGPPVVPPSPPPPPPPGPPPPASPPPPPTEPTYSPYPYAYPDWGPICSWISKSWSDYNAGGLDDYFQNWTDRNSPNMPTGTKVLLESSMFLPSIVSFGAEAVAKLLGLNDPMGIHNAYTVITWAELFSKLIGGDTEWLVTPVYQALRFSNPMEIPTQAEIDDQYLVNFITDSEWECGTKMHGNRPDLFRGVRNAKAERPNIQEIIELFMRKKIDRDTLILELRRRGVIDPGDAQRWLDLRVEIPVVSDLLRFMTHHTANERLIDWSLSDKWVEDNWVPPISTWGEMQGITLEVIKHEARAHWHIPSNTEVYEMVARLRPDRTDPALVFTKEDAEVLMKRNDTAPEYVDRLLAIGTIVPTVTDLKLGYKNRSITKDDVYQGMLDNRHNPQAARMLTDIYVADADRQIANESNLWSRRNIIQHFMGGSIDAGTADRLLARFVPDAGLRQQSISDAVDLSAAISKKACIKAVRTQQYQGYYTRLEAQEALTNLGVGPSIAGQLTQQWECEIRSGQREPTVRLVQQWYDEGIISYDDFYSRLIRLRYSDEDADRIVSTAEKKKRTREDAARTKAEQKAAAEAAKAAQQRQKELAAAARRAESDANAARARFRAEVGYGQRQRDRKAKRAKEGLPPDEYP